MNVPDRYITRLHSQGCAAKFFTFSTLVMLGCAASVSAGEFRVIDTDGPNAVASAAVQPAQREDGEAQPGRAPTRLEASPEYSDNPSRSQNLQPSRTSEPSGPPLPGIPPAQPTASVERQDHVIEAFSDGFQLAWNISGAGYRQATVRLAGEGGAASQSFTDLDSVSINVQDLKLPDGIFNYKLTVYGEELTTDQERYAQLTSSDDTNTSAAGCIVIRNEFSGDHCYFNGNNNSSKELDALGENLQSADTYRHSSDAGQVQVSNGQFRLLENITSE